jgi:hypothetical protein
MPSTASRPLASSVPSASDRSVMPPAGYMDKTAYEKTKSETLRQREVQLQLALRTRACVVDRPQGGRDSPLVTRACTDLSLRGDDRVQVLDQEGHPGREASTGNTHNTPPPLFFFICCILLRNLFFFFFEENQTVTFSL